MSAFALLVRIRRSRPQELFLSTSQKFFSTLRISSEINGFQPAAGEQKKKWIPLPSFEQAIDPTALGKEIVGKGKALEGERSITALKWVRRCCPRLPVALVHKLFRLRQVRKELQTFEGIGVEARAEKKLKRVSADEAINLGDLILLPASVQEFSPKKDEKFNEEDKAHLIHEIELYKDSAILAVNKPPGLPVQGGVGIKYSMDTLAASSLSHNTSESPRLVHRLDRDCSGVLVLGRTQISASILHTIFREKTSAAFSVDLRSTQRPLQRKYWALVLGTPKRSEGLISAPLGKTVLEDGKSERIIIVNDRNCASSQHALTEYKVVASSTYGYSWLELSPLTGRKHQLRVHCAEALGTPIVGDYKYGWNMHRRWKPVPIPYSMQCEKHPKHKLPFGLELRGGSVSEKQPCLHLHCRQMILPNVCLALDSLRSPSSDTDLSKLEKLDLVAPLPAHMQISWELLGYQT